MMLRCEFSGGSDGQLLSVSEDWLLPVVNQPLDPTIAFRTVADTLHEVLLDDDRLIDRFLACFKAIRNELHDNETGARTVVAAQFTTILTILYRQKADRLPGSHQGLIHSPLFQHFLQLIEVHFRDHWKVSDYAKHMGVTQRRLEAATQRDSHQSPAMLIQRKLISEACHRLACSPLSIGEVAYGLGFRDPAYFNRFFKRHMQTAPGAWRREVQAKEFHSDTTFAAWP